MRDAERRGISRLQARLAGRVLSHAREHGFGPGAWLSENALAQAFGVSRTPVRGALAELSKHGLLDPVPRKGYLLKRAICDQDLECYADARDDDDRVIERIALDRFTGHLADQVSETDLMRRYEVTRRTLGRVLSRMEQDTVIERRNGNGWRFVPALDSMQMFQESLRFRQVIEPAGILESTFRLDKPGAQRLREAHVALLGGGEKQLTSNAYLGLDVEFHDFIARCSSNRFLQQAVIQHNHLRRFFAYMVSQDAPRVRVACSEHVAVLDRLLTGELESAAGLLRRHLEAASRVRMRFVP